VQSPRLVEKNLPIRYRQATFKNNTEQHNKMNYFENKNEELSHEKTTVATMVSTLPSNQPSP